MNTITAIEALEAENAGEGQDVAESKKELHYITTLGDYPRNAAVINEEEVIQIFQILYILLASSGLH